MDKKTAWTIFGKSYEYREKYNKYKVPSLMLQHQRRHGQSGRMAI